MRVQGGGEEVGGARDCEGDCEVVGRGGEVEEYAWVRLEECWLRLSYCGLCV